VLNPRDSAPVAMVPARPGARRRGLVECTGRGRGGYSVAALTPKRPFGVN